MRDLNDKTTGSTLLAIEWNDLPSELQNIIEALGITLSSSDLNQLGKAIAGYVANGLFYSDSGAANAYVLSVIGSKQSVTGYTDGMVVTFVAGNTNTAASTVNVASLGVKNIKLLSGDDPAAGSINGNVRLKFDASNDRFELDRSGQVVTTIVESSTSFTPAPDTKTIKFTAIGGGGGAGGVDGQGAGTTALSPGAAAGSVVIKTISIIDSTYTITIGAGGVGGLSGANAGTQGGTTIVLSTNVSINSIGGLASVGITGNAGTGSFNGANGVVPNGGDINIRGSGGSISTIVNGDPVLYGDGGQSFHNSFASAPIISSIGLIGATYGGGASGSASIDVATNFAGADGADGVVIVEEFI